MAPNPFVGGYRPETDMIDPLDPDKESYYQTMIEFMRWMVEIGRINIATECSLLSSHLAYPPRRTLRVCFAYDELS